MKFKKISSLVALLMLSAWMPSQASAKCHTSEAARGKFHGLCGSLTCGSWSEPLSSVTPYTQCRENNEAILRASKGLFGCYDANSDLSCNGEVNRFISACEQFDNEKDCHTLKSATFICGKFREIVNLCYWSEPTK